MVIDIVGGPGLASSYATLRPGGRLVALSAPPDAERARAVGVQAMFFVVTPDVAELASPSGRADRYRPAADGGQPDVPAGQGRAAF